MCVGLAPDPDGKRLPLDSIPAKPRRIGFFDAPLQADLIRAFLNGPRARWLEYLFIGTSHDYAAKRPAGYDMTAPVAALKGASLPALKGLSLGDMECLFNGHRMFGTLGDITYVFDAAPALTRLWLQGHFRLPAPVRHSRLEELCVEVDDIGITDGPLNQVTVSSLLSSTFPNLATCDLDLEVADEDALYTLPAAFLTKAAFPALRVLHVNALTPPSGADLAAWKGLRGLR